MADELLKRAVGDREAHPWRYYRLDHDVMKKLLDEMAAKLEALAWQPIETAPKDGTRILLARKQTLSGELIVVSGGWNSGGAMHMPHWSTLSNMHAPTHWMPLPSAPRAKEGD